MKRVNGYLQKSFWHHNKRNSIVGTGAGIVIVIVESALNNRLLPLQRAVFTVMFSVLITLGITNSVLFYARFFKPQK